MTRAHRPGGRRERTALADDASTSNVTIRIHHVVTAARPAAPPTRLAAHAGRLRRDAVSGSRRAGDRGENMLPCRLTTVVVGGLARQARAHVAFALARAPALHRALGHAGSSRAVARVERRLAALSYV